MVRTKKKNRKMTNDKWTEKRGETRATDQKRRNNESRRRKKEEGRRMKKDDGKIFLLKKKIYIKHTIVVDHPNSQPQHDHCV